MKSALAVIGLILGLISYGSAYAVEASGPAAVAQCMEKEFRKAGFPETQAYIGMGQDYFCVNAVFLPGDTVVVDPEYREAPQFRFKKTLFGFNDELLGYEPVWEYAIAQGPDHHEAWVSILKGIQDGFMRRSIRMTAQGELIVEDSFFEPDAIALGLEHTPQSALDPDNRVERYSICRKRPENWSIPYQNVCLQPQLK